MHESYYSPPESIRDKLAIRYITKASRVAGTESTSLLRKRGCLALVEGVDMYAFATSSPRNIRPGREEIPTKHRKLRDRRRHYVYYDHVCVGM